MLCRHSINRLWCTKEEVVGNLKDVKEMANELFGTLFLKSGSNEEFKELQELRKEQLDDCCEKEDEPEDSEEFFDKLCKKRLRISSRKKILRAVKVWNKNERIKPPDVTLNNKLIPARTFTKEDMDFANEKIKSLDLLLPLLASLEMNMEWIQSRLLRIYRHVGYIKKVTDDDITEGYSLFGTYIWVITYFIQELQFEDVREKDYLLLQIRNLYIEAILAAEIVNQALVYLERKMRKMRREVIGILDLIAQIWNFGKFKNEVIYAKRPIMKENPFWQEYQCNLQNQEGVYMFDQIDNLVVRWNNYALHVYVPGKDKRHEWTEVSGLVSHERTQLLTSFIETVNSKIAEIYELLEQAKEGFKQCEFQNHKCDLKILLGGLNYFLEDYQESPKNATKDQRTEFINHGRALYDMYNDTHDVSIRSLIVSQDMLKTVKYCYDYMIQFHRWSLPPQKSFLTSDPTYVPTVIVSRKLGKRSLMSYLYAYYLYLNSGFRSLVKKSDPLFYEYFRDVEKVEEEFSDDECVSFTFTEFASSYHQKLAFQRPIPNFNGLYLSVDEVPDSEMSRNIFTRHYLHQRSRPDLIMKKIIRLKKKRIVSATLWTGADVP